MKKDMNTWTPKLIMQILCAQNYNQKINNLNNIYIMWHLIK